MFAQCCSRRARAAMCVGGHDRCGPPGASNAHDLGRLALEVHRGGDLRLGVCRRQGVDYDLEGKSASTDGAAAGAVSDHLRWRKRCLANLMAGAALLPTKRLCWRVCGAVLGEAGGGCPFCSVAAG